MINYIRALVRSSEQPLIEGVFNLDDYVKHIQDNTFKDIILKTRKFDKSKKLEYRKLKQSLPLIYYYGELGMDVITDINREFTLNNLNVDMIHDTNRFKGKIWLHLKKYNGFIVLDVDDVDVDVDVETIKQIPWVTVVHLSASGKGFRVLIQTDNYDITKFAEYYEKVTNSFNTITGLKCDRRVKSTTVCFFSSWDQEIYYNPNALKYCIGVD